MHALPYPLSILPINPPLRSLSSVLEFRILWCSVAPSPCLSSPPPVGRCCRVDLLCCLPDPVPLHIPIGVQLMCPLPHSSPTPLLPIGPDAVLVGDVVRRQHQWHQGLWRGYCLTYPTPASLPRLLFQVIEEVRELVAVEQDPLISACASGAGMGVFVCVASFAHTTSVVGGGPAP